jgi:hypothetical protein
MSTPEALDPEPLLRFLHVKGVAHIIIGGVAVAAHGYARPNCVGSSGWNGSKRGGSPRA